MSARFLVLAHTIPADEPLTCRIAKHAEEALGLRECLATPSVRVLVDPATPVISIDGKGIIVGDLFCKAVPMAPVIDLDNEAANLALRSDGASLIEHYWGEYITILADKSVTVLREPSGSFPCLYHDVRSVRLFASDVDTLELAGGLRASIDWSHLGREIRYSEPRSPATCIAGISEVMPGEAMSLDRGSWHRRLVWDPWSFAAPEQQIWDRAEAVAALRQVLVETTRVWSRRTRKPLLELSGGLDSSIIAACLREAGADLTCVSFMTTDPGADERRYAKTVAEHIGAPLHVVQLDPEATDVTDISPRRRPRPSDHTLGRTIDQALQKQAGAHGTDAFFSGSGGDYVLGYFTTTAPAADALLGAGFGRTTWNAMSDLAALHRTDILRVARLSLRKAWTRNAARSAGASAFLTGKAQVLQPPSHSWFPAPAAAWPGKKEQINALAGGQGFREGRDRDILGANRAPILAQPVVELCLRIPSWMCVTDGKNRAVARDAFAQYLPESIIGRRSKGDFTGFIAGIFSANRTKLQDLLLGGCLEQAGLVDRRALEQHLRQERDPSDISFTQILHLAGAEAWARRW